MKYLTIISTLFFLSFEITLSICNPLLPELIDNGDFSKGNINITTNYSYDSTTGWNETVYTIRPSAGSWHPDWGQCGDHTSGIDNMMLVNGSSSKNKILWSRIVNIKPKTLYKFSMWAMSLAPENPANLIYIINGKILGSALQLPSKTCQWVQYQTEWFSDIFSQVTIVIIDINTNQTGNDFAIDDISLKECDCPQLQISLPDTAAVPGTDNFCIPINAKFNNYQDTVILNYKLRLEFDADAFIPNSVTKGKIVKNEINGSKRIVEIQADSIFINGGLTLLTEICGSILLASKDISQITLDSFSCQINYLCLVTPDGSLKLDSVCSSTLRKIQLFTPLRLDIVNSVSGDNVTINIESSEKSSLLLSVYNIQSRLFEEFKINSDEKLSGKSISLNSKNYPAGIYLLVLKTSTQAITKTFYIVR